MSSNNRSVIEEFKGDAEALKRWVMQIDDAGASRTVRGYNPDAFEWRRINPDGTPDEDLIRGLAAGIAEGVKPRKIILFGSAARGQMNGDSDIDILVVMEHENRRLAEIAVHKSLPPGPRAIDIIAVRPEAMEHKTGTGRLLMMQAEAEGAGAL